ncbi:MAG TPA: beta-L-arabinofuranosidase domain-containing protein, partial [Rugosimonospora sp.]|nr:beta-L-arabinofuranosidase domain-containing protein [Rugosimonospora sp.]
MSQLSRRDMLRLAALGVAAPTALTLPPAAGGYAAATAASTGSLTGAGAQVPLPVPPSWVVKPFDNNQVTLHDSLFTANRDRVSQFLLNYPIDNMLYLFRLNAGLPTLGASAPGAWEVAGGNLRGHYAGHFLSAHALGYAGSGNTAFLDRVNYFVTALGQCQDALNAQVGGTTPVTWPAGKFGNAVGLDGASNYVSLPSGIVSGLHDFTIATWVRPSTVTTWSRVFDFGTGTSRYMFLTVSAGSGRPRFAISTGGSGAEQQLSSTQSISANAWTHLAVTLSGTTGTLYLNGVAVATNTNMTLNPAGLGTTGNNWIGRSQYGDPLLSGAVDDFQIYDHALTQAGVQALMSGPGSGNVACYRFDETTGATAHDTSGNGRNAAVFSGTSSTTGPSHAGYLAAYPETQFIALESFATYPTVWAPWYTFHMILRGLLDAYVYCGNAQALTIAKGMGDWAWSRLGKLSRATLDGMWHIYIAGEYNAAPAALTDLSVLTGNGDYFSAAQSFVNTYLFDAAVSNQDTLTGEHANQHIPQYLGYLAMYERFTGSDPVYRGPAVNYLTAAMNFWDMVV